MDCGKSLKSFKMQTNSLEHYKQSLMDDFIQNIHDQNADKNADSKGQAEFSVDYKDSISSSTRDCACKLCQKIFYILSMQ